MDGCKGFRPSGPQVTVTAAVTAPTGVQAAGPVAGEVSYMIFNAGAVAAWVGFGPDAATATTNSVIPTAGNAQPVVCVPPGATRTFNLSPGLFFSGATASSTALLYITPGDGIGE